MLPIINAGMCETPIGVLVHRWTTIGLFQVELFADRSMIKTPDFPSNAADNRSACEFEEFIDQFFAGQLPRFHDVAVDDSNWSPFFARVYQQCRRVAPGETISYKELARRAGRPAAARAVGQAMARNRIPIVIPCHRIVGSTGRLTGFSAPGGIDTKRRLLQHETDCLPRMKPAATSKCKIPGSMSLTS